MKSKSNTSRLLSELLALSLAVLLSACAGQKETTLPPDLTLPSIGVDEIDPDAAAAAEMSSRSAASSENRTEPPETTLPSGTTQAETPEMTVPSGEESTKAPEPPATLPPETTAAPPPETTAPTEPQTTAPPATTAAPTEPQTTEPPETTAPTPPPETSAAPPTTEAPSGVRVWMGDSRFVGYSQDVSYDASRDVFISGWGKGYDWMLETAFPEFEKLAAEKHIDICYWSLGANDITNDPSDYNLELAEKYVTELKKLMAKHPDTIFYLLSYGPVDEEGMDPNNIPDCDAYNKALWIFIDYIREHSSMIYLDQGEYIERTGFRVYDGCHYDPETNRRAFAYVLAQSGQ